MKAYFISGLGADKRAFEKIVLPAAYEVVHLAWVPPLEKECLVQYARRFAQYIDNSEPFILVGLSFGGMLATEISKLVPPQHLILISSVSTRYELPFIYRLAGSLRLEKLIPYKKLTKKPGKLFNWLFGPLDNDCKAMLHSFVKEVDPLFLKWALGQISRWRNTAVPANLLQIHGSRDRVLWTRYSKASLIMSGGGHLCLHSHANVINGRLASHLG